MDSLAQNPYAAGAVILALVAAIVTIVKLHDKRTEKFVSTIAQMMKDHQEEAKGVRSETAAQTMIVLDAVKADAVSSEKLSHSIDELKTQGKENTRIQQESSDRLTQAFYDILNQKRP